MIPAKEAKLRVEDVAEAMKVEFEQRQENQEDDVAFYAADAIHAPAATNRQFDKKDGNS